MHTVGRLIQMTSGGRLTGRSRELVADADLVLVLGNLERGAPRPEKSISMSISAATFSSLIAHQHALRKSSLHRLVYSQLERTGVCTIPPESRVVVHYFH